MSSTGMNCAVQTGGLSLGTCYMDRSNTKPPQRSNGVLPNCRSAFTPEKGRTLKIGADKGGWKLSPLHTVR